MYVTWALPSVRVKVLKSDAVRPVPRLIAPLVALSAGQFWRH